ncbi:MAG: MazG family protein [Eubacteriales bacterium]|jgi:tetrapyrrole methylase family protein/MazG family protein|nr:MazG family protein [Eubacteriales bacterium]
METNPTRKKIAGKIKALTENRDNRTYDINDLVDIMAILRSEDGCPWDREQDHTTIRQNFIEETYEAVEAIDNGDMELLREELGDVLLQVVFHARISQEDGYFSFDEVANDICLKLIERHPHIFGTVEADTPQEVLRNWEQIKQRTKDRKDISQILDGVAKSLPSLMRAGKLAKKLVNSGEEPEPEPERRLSESEYGERLFALAAECALAGFEPEKTLYDACERVIARVAE